MAQSIGLALDSPQRIMAAIKHVLAASREFGHCYLTQSQIQVQVKDLIELDLGNRLPDLLKQSVTGLFIAEIIMISGCSTVILGLFRKSTMKS